MKKLILAFTALLFIISSCAPQPTSELLPVSETPSPIPTITAIPLPDISPVEWASNESGVVIPQKMYPLVGAIGKKHRRTIDLDYAGLRIALVLGEGVDLQDPEFITKQKDIRSFYAEELNKQEALKQQLEQVRALLDKQGATQNAVTVIEGQNWSSDLSVSPPTALVSQVVEFVVKFGEIEQDEIKARYVLENAALRQLTQEEEPQLLPKITIKGKDFYRTDTNEPVTFKGFTVATPFHADSVSLQDAFYFTKESHIRKANFINIHYSTDRIKSKRDELKKIIKFAEAKGIYVNLIPVGTKYGKYQENEPLPTDEVVNTVGFLANELKLFHNAFFDIYNEPNTPPEHPITPQEWKSYLDTVRFLINIVRNQAASDAPIFITGLDWGRDFRNDELLRLNQEYINIGYRVQDVAGVWPFEDPNANIVSARYQWETLLDREHAIIVGELGFPTLSVRRNTPAEKKYIIEGIDLAKKHGYGLTIFALAPFNWGGTTLLTGIQYQPDGSFSYIYKENSALPFVELLQSDPPYQFDE